MTRTGKSRRLMAAEREPFLQLHPDDAQAAGVADGGFARVRSRRGWAILRVRLDDTLAPGTAFAPFHWGALHAPAGAGAVNNLTHRATDPVSRQPGLKAAAIRVEPVSAARSATGSAPAPIHRPEAERRPPRGAWSSSGGTGGVATAESVIANSAPGAWQITLVGREPGLPYNRVALSDHLAGHRTSEALALHDGGWYHEHGVTLHSGDEVVSVDTTGRIVSTRSGLRLPYDSLVLATGSKPLMPPIEGVDLDGVFAFRTEQDAREILEHAGEIRRVAVIGGGLLGLEAARGLALQGLEGPSCTSWTA